MSPEDAWNALKAADENRDLDDFRSVRLAIINFQILLIICSRLSKLIAKPLETPRMINWRRPSVQTNLMFTWSLRRSKFSLRKQLSICKENWIANTRLAFIFRQSQHVRPLKWDGRRALRRTWNVSKTQELPHLVACPCVCDVTVCYPSCDIDLLFDPISNLLVKQLTLWCRYQEI